MAITKAADVGLIRHGGEGGGERVALAGLERGGVVDVGGFQADHVAVVGGRHV